MLSASTEKLKCNIWHFMKCIVYTYNFGINARIAKYRFLYSLFIRINRMYISADVGFIPDRQTYALHRLPRIGGSGLRPEGERRSGWCHRSAEAPRLFFRLRRSIEKRHVALLGVGLSARKIDMEKREATPLHHRFHLHASLYESADSPSLTQAKISGQNKKRCGQRAGTLRSVMKVRSC